MGTTSNAAMATKAKAMFGKRLTASDYQQLLQKKSIPEIASYLKNETLFQEALEGYSETGLHRGQLEMLIRRDLGTRLSRLLRYASTSGDKFYHYGIMMSEVEQIMACIRAFNDEDNYKMIGELPLYIEKSTSFDIRALAQVHDFGALLEVLDKTPYADLIRPFSVTNMEDFDYTACESVLRKYFYDQAMKIVDQEFSGKVKKEIKEIFLTQIELDNITRIYRSKRYFNATPAQIKKVINPVYLRIPKRELEEMIDHCNAEEFMERLARSAYHNYLDSSNFAYIEYHAQSINYNLNKRHMMFSTNPDIVLIAYLVLSETEIQNVVDIIEGVRYGIPADKINRLLIY